MVQVISDPYGGSIFGRLGAGIGKGISENLPQAIQRGAAGSALERLANTPDLTPIQQISRLVSQGQMQPNEAAQFLPYIQDAQRRQALKSRVEGQPISDQSKLQNALAQQPTEQIPKRPIESIRPEKLEKVKKAKESLLKEPSQAELDRLKFEALQSGQAFTEKEADAIARERYKTTQTSQKTNITDFKTALNDAAGRVLQGTGLNDFKDVEGRIIQDQLDLGEADILGGENPASVELDRRKLLEKLGQASNKIKEIANKSLFTSRPSEKIKQWLQQKPLFEKEGYKNEFVDLVAGHQNITRMEAAHAVDPIKNQKLEKKLNESRIPKIKSFTNLMGYTNIGNAILKQVTKENILQPSDSYLNEIIDLIKPGDNLLDIAWHFRKNGIDTNSLFSAIRQADNEKQFLTDEQLYQLEQPVKNEFYGDILFEARS